MGKTITTDTQTGTIIISLLTVCTTLATTHLWHLITFLYYYTRAGGKPVVPVVRQQQVLLRTMPSPATVIIESLKMLWAWKKIPNTKGVVMTSVVHILIALLYVLGTTAAGISSSYALSSSDIEVLVNSPLCGYANNATESSPSNSYISSVMTTAAQYAEECYQPKTSLSSKCHVFTQPNIPFTVENASCPFNSSMCASPALAYDTGRIDVQDVFGINLPGSAQLQYRLKTTCTILSMEGRTSIVSARDLPMYMVGAETLPQEQAMLLHLGTQHNVPERWANVTSCFAINSANMSMEYRAV